MSEAWLARCCSALGWGRVGGWSSTADPAFPAVRGASTVRASFRP
ncbi:hypothetical protein FM106_09900 [Brachybacterium faecium]|nr:hypothetical protein FM106_09900 [Brachybacterium faecium]